MTTLPRPRRLWEKEYEGGETSTVHLCLLSADLSPISQTYVTLYWDKCQKEGPLPHSQLGLWGEMPLQNDPPDPEWQWQRENSGVEACREGLPESLMYPKWSEMFQGQWYRPVWQWRAVALYIEAKWFLNWVLQETPLSKNQIRTIPRPSANA